MEEHLVSRVDQLPAPEPVHSLEQVEAPRGSCSHAAYMSSTVIDIKGAEQYDAAGEDEPLIQTLECRICQEEDSIKNLEVPCACSGSLKYAHRKCVQRWCNEKGDTICEICHQAYQAGYTAPPPQTEDTVIDISGSWTLAGTPLDLNDPRLLAMAAAERRLLETDYDEYDDSNASGASFCRSAALILMALLLLRHALTIGDGDGDDDDASTFFAVFLLRAAGFLLPCYIMAWAISILQRRRQAEGPDRLEVADAAFNALTYRGLQVTITPGPSSAPAPTSTVAPPSPAVTPVRESHQ